MRSSISSPLFFFSCIAWFMKSGMTLENAGEKDNKIKKDMPDDQRDSTAATMRDPITKEMNTRTVNCKYDQNKRRQLLICSFITILPKLYWWTMQIRISLACILIFYFFIFQILHFINISRFIREGRVSVGKIRPSDSKCYFSLFAFELFTFSPLSLERVCKAAPVGCGGFSVEKKIKNKTNKTQQHVGAVADVEETRRSSSSQEAGGAARECVLRLYV